MSGTSLDGVDVALVKIDGSGKNTTINLIDFLEYPFPNGLKDKILANSLNESSGVKDISQLNFLLPHLYTDAIKSICNKNNLKLDEIDLIGSHGQTIQHIPDMENYFNYDISSTLQIGDPAVLSKLTGVVTVGDFRTGDMALGGEGAPLIPYFDYIIFRSLDKNRALLNIGGISNITVLKKNCLLDDIIAFDLGPGNMLIDYLAQKFFNSSYDRDGNIARSGFVDMELFNSLISYDNFIEKLPPKSTGRELYNSKFIDKVLSKFNSISKINIMNTFTRFTAYAIKRNYELFIKENIEIDELIISGGGAKNNFLINCIQEYFKGIAEIKAIDDLGIPSEAKEAIGFAVLANETISGNPTNVPSVTGATKQTILGKICLP